MIVVLNGGSSSGKTTIARALQEVLPGTWLRLSVDDLVEALPPDAIGYGAGGEVTPGDGFREAEAAWMAGVAAMARAGAGVILDDVFLGGAASQHRVRVALEGLDVLWVGVRCDPEVAEARERGRPDRVPGMAALQAEVVHEGVVYDLEVDTTAGTAADCARAIAARVG